MFSERSLSGELAAIRNDHAPDALVLDCERDFETLPPDAADELALLTDQLRPASFPTEWLPPDAPQLLVRQAGSELTIGQPDDGSVAWTRQTDPPAVFVKPRVQGSPEPFVEFLIADALVELGTDEPEGVLPFFGGQYVELADAVPLDGVPTYQIAAALRDGWVGRSTREIYAEWRDEYPRLADAWTDAGERLQPRVSELPAEVARGRTDFADATELACSAIKHGIELPAPFAALDTAAYRDHGAEYAVEWARKTFEKL